MPVAWRKGDFSALLDPAQTGAQRHPALQPVFAGRHHRAARSVSQQRHSRQPAEFGGDEAVCNNQTLYPAPQYNRFTDSELLLHQPRAICTATRATSSWTGGPRKRTTSRRVSPTAARINPGLNTFPLLYNSFNTSPFQNGVINWTRTISPRLVNEARVGVNNVMLDNGGADKGLGDIAQQAGHPECGAGLLLWPSTAAAFNYATGIGNANIGTQQLFANTTYHYADNLTITRGRHMMKMGGQCTAPVDQRLLLRQQRPQRLHQLHRPLYRAERRQPRGHTDRRGRLHAGSARATIGRGLADRNLGPALHHLRLLLPGRLARHQQSDPESRAALGIPHAAGWRSRTARRTSTCSRDNVVAAPASANLVRRPERRRR